MTTPPKYSLESATNENCPARLALSLLEGKWKVLILFHLFNGEQRPGNLEKLIGDVTRQVLTQQLKELEAAGIVRKTVFAEVPPRVEYSLTEFGRRFEPVLDLLYDLGQHHARQVQPNAAVTETPCRKVAETAPGRMLNVEG